MKIRVIVQSEADGKNEQVIFTDDFSSHCSEFEYPSCSIDSDDIIECNFPAGFPINRNMMVDE